MAESEPGQYALEEQGPPPRVARLPAGIRRIGDVAMRQVGIATSSLRPPPDFLLIGAKRGGTTALYRALMRHPDVRELYPSFLHIKSPHYFDLNYGEGPAWYRSHFPIALPGQSRRWISGDASPYYLFHPQAPNRAEREAPGARIIALLRDPVDRAVSHHWDRLKNGIEHLSLAEAIAAEPARLAGERERLEADPNATSDRYEHFSYVARGRYAGQIRRWLDAYPADRLLVIRSEDLFTAPGPVFAQVLAFLGLTPLSLPVLQRHHGHADKPRLNDRQRRELATVFAQPNAELADLLGTPLWWDARGSTALSSPGVVMGRRP
ncbi:MAG: hypothetical protein QOJ75_1180 [Chloroflexota bacterium]|nr:hypothetical protein [Chloroflexota bacterium]